MAGNKFFKIENQIVKNSISSIAAVAEGSTLTGSTANAVVYTNGTNDLTTSATLSYDESLGQFLVGDGIGHNFLNIDPSSGNYNIGDINSLVNGTNITITDSTKVIRLNANNASISLDGNSGSSIIGDVNGSEVLQILQ